MPWLQWCRACRSGRQATLTSKAWSKPLCHGPMGTKSHDTFDLWKRTYSTREEWLSSHTLLPTSVRLINYFGQDTSKVHPGGGGGGGTSPLWRYRCPVISCKAMQKCLRSEVRDRNTLKNERVVFTPNEHLEKIAVHHPQKKLQDLTQGQMLWFLCLLGFFRTTGADSRREQGCLSRGKTKWM